MKSIYCPIHKYMKFEKEVLDFIDTFEFQRLRNIKQLGVCYYVFPGASHNRFEHSLGVAHLSFKMIKGLQIRQPELNISDKTCILIKIAGLLHDIGHVCFSHFFDNILLPKFVKNHKYQHHEARSCAILEYMIKKYNLNFSNQEVQFIKDVISPTKENKGYLYQIVANYKSGLDCDKIDYLLRDCLNVGVNYIIDFDRLIDTGKVIENELCYPYKIRFSIYHVYYTRYCLHKQVYTHPVTSAIEYMIMDILLLANNFLKISERLDDIEFYLNLTDNILDIINLEPSLVESKKILNRIYKRDFYKLLISGLDEFEEKDKALLRKKNEIIVQKINLDLSKGDKNPIEYVSFFNSKDPTKKFNINGKEAIGLVPENCKETITRIYFKNKKPISKEI
jgi:deoxynucleoside triphosphate triphosphohydrolase SAMHD1